MGIVNVTPDSFYDGGRHAGASSSQRHVDELIDEGADILDIGGESTRPGAPPVSADEQIRRIEPAVKHAVGQNVLVSVDTTQPTVAEHALALGAQIINDVSCLADAKLARAVACHGGILVLMHSRGSMTTMPGFSVYPEKGYDDVVEDVKREWRRARDRAVDAGMDGASIWLDPGLGFNKNARHSLTLLGRLDELRTEGHPIVLGASRKSFIAHVDGSPPNERLGGSIAACILATKMGVSVLRVHDVRATLQALRLTAEADAMAKEAQRA